MENFKNMIDDLGYDVLGLEKVLYATGVLSLGVCGPSSCDGGCSGGCWQCSPNCQNGGVVKKE